MKNEVFPPKLFISKGCTKFPMTIYSKELYLLFIKVVRSQKLDLRQKKIILLINFIFAQTYFLIASSQIFKNNAILINHDTFF